MGINLDFKPKGFHLRPDLVKKEKVGIAFVLIITLFNFLLIYYLLSFDISDYPKFVTGLTEWVKQTIACSHNWGRASVVYYEELYPIYFQSLASILIICALVILTTPKKQLFVWARDVSAGRAFFLILVHLVGLVVFMCFIGNVYEIGDTREQSRFGFLFNSYPGIALVAAVAVNALTYYAVLSMLLYAAILRKLF
ncbi:MAG: hypothetical protein KZQ73_00010 [Candidatus Thiodiazotropha sp. (ex Semelilucina semeliformis)]|nr:hypothetical protein [Candidatus Thiodiazotropha sp. (ex Semelilucina semeliformis)]